MANFFFWPLSFFHVGPSRVSKGPRQDGSKSYFPSISEYDIANIPLSPNFENPWGPSRDWKGVKQDGPKTSFSHVGPNKFSKGPRQDGSKSYFPLISEYDIANIPPSPNFQNPWGPSRDWKGVKQDGPKMYSRLISQYEDANTPPSKNFQKVLASNRLP